MKEYLIVFPDNARLKYYASFEVLEFGVMPVMDLITAHIRANNREPYAATVFEWTEVDGKEQYIKLHMFSK